MKLTGTVLWYKNRPSDHSNHIHAEPPVKMTGTPPLTNPGMTDGVRRIYDALEARFGKGAYFLDVDHHWEPDKFIIDEPGIGWVHMGGYNRRTISGSRFWSQHSWWNALDIGPYYDEDQEVFYDYLINYEEGDDEMKITIGDSGRTVRAIKKGYNAWRDATHAGTGKVDENNEDYGPTMASLIAAFQRWSELPVATGDVDGFTFAALVRWEKDAEQGPAGPEGPEGPRGPKGDKGDPGEGAELPDREFVEIVRG